VPGEIDRVTYGTSRAGLLLVGAPIEEKRRPANLVGAQFSAPFVLATALATGDMGWSSYQRLHDPVIRALMQRVSCVHDDEAEAHYPSNMAGRLTIETRGRVFSEMVAVPLGEPANFLPVEQLIQKYADLAGPVLEKNTTALSEMLLSLDTLDDLGSLHVVGRPAGV
jgi:2-methylcitrate dehydratase PrpD